MYCQLMHGFIAFQLIGDRKAIKTQMPECTTHARMFANVQIVLPTTLARPDLVFPGQGTALGPGYGKTIGT